MRLAFKKLFQPHILALLFVFVALVLLLLFAYERQRDTAHVIELHSDGFSPDSLTIAPGETVTFITKTGMPFWPASDEHPSHLAYPAFDPQKPVSSGESWSYTFTESGTYAFHDHIRSAHTGTIIVQDDTTTGVAVRNDPETFDTCLHENNLSLKITCWNEYLRTQISQRGVAAAFVALKQVYNADPEFVSYGCHGAVHEIGEAAYAVYQEEGDLALDADTGVCGYGFFHGFMEQLLYDNPNLDNAREFCDGLTAKLGGELRGIRTNCFHGIGHGMVEEDPLPEYYWGNLGALVDPALEVCSRISPERGEVRECADGAFNGLMRFMVYDKYGFEYNENDPLTWCDRYRDNEIFFESCLFESAQHFASQVINYDIARIVPFIEGYDESLQSMMVRTVVAGMLQRDIVREDNSDYFSRCWVLPTDALQQSCLGGVLNGFIAHGEPGNEQQKAKQFCESPQATKEQADLCHRLLTAYSS